MKVLIPVFGVLAAAAAGGLVLTSNSHQEPFIEISELTIPDHATGSNPTITYDRFVRRDTIADWVVEVMKKKDGAFTEVCSGSGRSDYRLDEDRSSKSMVWDVYVGRRCNVSPGTYKVITSWRTIGWLGRADEVRATSNEFTVSPISLPKIDG